MPEHPVELARRRARRLRASGNYRKAALALREWVRHTDAPQAWVAFGAMLARARRNEQALQALREGLWRFRRQGELARARSVARLILTMDPTDVRAGRVAGLAV
jgi:hypothetical protein